MCAVTGTQPIVHSGRWQYSDQRYQLRDSLCHRQWQVCGVGTLGLGHLREAIWRIASKNS